MRLKQFVERMVGAKTLREYRCNLLALRSYLDRSLDFREDVHWLLLLTFPNGGSTALAKFLLTAPHTMALTDNAEGQWLIPSLCKPGVRWERDHVVWSRKLRSVWLAQVGATEGAPVLVIEKSPPNTCRHQFLMAALHPMKTYIATFSRDPYATCASWHKRYGLNAIVRGWKPSANPSGLSEAGYFSFLGQIWLERANMLLVARKESTIDIRYEDFADDPSTVARRLASVIPQLNGISPTAKVVVKDYGEQKVANMNERQIATLSSEQIAAISSALSAEPHTVESLGYSIR